MSKSRISVWIFFTAAALLSILPVHALGSCDPHQYGAKGDGTTKDTAAIQQAIEVCAQKAGEVRLEADTYLSAPIELKSNITLRLDKGAPLLGSPDHSDYPPHEEF